MTFLTKIGIISDGNLFIYLFILRYRNAMKTP